VSARQGELRTPHLKTYLSEIEGQEGKGEFGNNPLLSSLTLRGRFKERGIFGIQAFVELACHLDFSL